MLEIKCPEHMDRVRAYARERGIEADLDEKLAWLGDYACHGDAEKTRCELFADWAPHSFEFVMYRRRDNGEYTRWFNGGLIYSGPTQPLDGSAPALTVSLAPAREGWSVHT